jgi:hypothetical protein
MAARSLEDLRGGFNRLMEHEQAAKNAVPAEPAARPFMTQARIDLFRTMLSERFEPAEAKQRFEYADWSKMGRAEFDRFFTWLKAQPKLARAAKAPAKAQDAPKAAASVTVPLIEGKFTVSFLDGGPHKTLRVRRQDEDASFKPGVLLVGHLTGSDNDSDYTNVGHVTGGGQVVIWKKHRGNERLELAVRVLMAEPQAAAAAYAEESGSCSACGRTLTAPVSENPFRAMGLGPECGKKSGW